MQWLWIWLWIYRVAAVSASSLWPSVLFGDWVSPLAGCWIGSQGTSSKLWSRCAVFYATSALPRWHVTSLALFCSWKRSKDYFGFCQPDYQAAVNLAYGVYSSAECHSWVSKPSLTCDLNAWVSNSVRGQVICIYLRVKFKKSHFIGY